MFPGGRVEPADLVSGQTEADDARRAAARETAEEVGLVVDPAALHPISCWTPPAGIPKRIRTWFFLGTAAEAVELTLSAAEVVSAEWAAPADVLDRHARGELTLYPPTWVTLHGMVGFADAAAAVAGARAQGLQEFATVIRRRAVFAWAPDVAHDRDADLDASGPRHRLLTDSLPWRYLKTA